MRTLELFCGAGGMAEGFRRAGIEFDLAFDADSNACESYEANLGKRPIQMDCRDLLRMVGDGWCPGDTGLLVADPPCTPWSRAGKGRGLEDDRDMLRETAELIRALHPLIWLIGNIPGLDDSNNWGTVQEVIGSLTQDGYCIDYQKLDAANHGVPQRRVRPFWFGHRTGTPCIRWPKPTHGDPETIGSAELGDDRWPWTTCRDALSHLSPEELGRGIQASRNRRCNGKHKVGSDPEKPARVVGTSSLSDGNLLCGMPSGAGAEWPWDRPATTVRDRDELSQPGRDGRAGESQSASAIILSEKAAAILQGFPETWVFVGKTKKARWSQIGQAMPPALAHAVAESIVDQKRKSIPL